MKSTNKKSLKRVVKNSKMTKINGVYNYNWINNLTQSDDFVEEAKNWVDFNEL